MSMHFRYEDQGRMRPIIHRASTVEIIVPYGDPRSPFHKKCAFDVVVSPALTCVTSSLLILLASFQRSMLSSQEEHEH